jgi:hypothetical protein
MSVIIPGSSRPSNLHFHDGVTVRMVDSDVYRICDRVKEISDRLFIVVASEGAKHAFIIMEHCDDGVDRRVYRTNELDGRVIEKLRKMMHMPLDERVRVLEKEEAANEAARKEAEFEELYERLGGPLRYQLWHDGFIDHRDKSYPKRKRNRARKGIVGS